MHDILTTQHWVDEYLQHHLPPSPVALFDDVLRYSVITPGKRVRPHMIRLFADAYALPREQWLPFAGALEVIHCYSLIHDDLPCMDNADTRHGRPSCHKLYGEALTVLAGDALIPWAFELITETPTRPQIMVDLIACLAKASAHTGMVGGQVMDILGSNTTYTLEHVQSLHRLKTGALLGCALEGTGILAEVPHDHRDMLREIGETIGLMYQITDDVLDATASAQHLGKPTGQDKDLDKKTIMTFMIVDQAMAYKHELATKIEHQLSRLHVYPPTIQNFIETLIARSY